MLISQIQFKAKLRINSCNARIVKSLDWHSQRNWISEGRDRMFTQNYKTPKKSWNDYWKTPCGPVWCYKFWKLGVKTRFKCLVKPYWRFGLGTQGKDETSICYLEFTSQWKGFSSKTSLSLKRNWRKDNLCWKALERTSESSRNHYRI